LLARLAIRQRFGSATNFERHMRARCSTGSITAARGTCSLRCNWPPAPTALPSGQQRAQSAELAIRGEPRGPVTQPLCANAHESACMRGCAVIPGNAARSSTCVATSRAWPSPTSGGAPGR
jgi:hypothetical protein